MDRDEHLKLIRTQLAAGEEALDKARAKIDAAALELKKCTDDADECEVSLAQMKVLASCLESGGSYMSANMVRDECRLPHDRFDAALRRMVASGKVVG